MCECVHGGGGGGGGGVVCDVCVCMCVWLHFEWSEHGLRCTPGRQQASLVVGTGSQY